MLIFSKLLTVKYSDQRQPFNIFYLWLKLPIIKLNLFHIFKENNTKYVGYGGVDYIEAMPNYIIIHCHTAYIEIYIPIKS